MSNKRKQYSPQFKARIALEAIKGDKIVPELASQYELHLTLIIVASTFKIVKKFLT